MELLELITDDEREMIRHQIAEHSMTNESRADMSNWNFNHVFREWNYAKSNFLGKIFGDKLILRKEVEFSKGTDELIEQLDDIFYPDCFNKLLAIFDNLSYVKENTYWTRNYAYDGYPACLESLSSQSSYLIRRAMYILMSNECLATNIYDGETVEIPIPNGKTIKINRGCRSVKTIGKLVEAFGLDTKEFERYRIEHSQVLNQKKLKGNLCLSIHPLDYITMSDNACGWESCMSWEQHGCYRQGTIEMMNSQYVVVAYLEADKPMRISHDNYWSNKKWRELYVVHPHMITNVKGYPYCNPSLTTEILKWLRELVHESGVLDTQYKEKIYHWGGRDDEDELYKDKKICPHLSTYMMYNDFGHNYHYCVINEDVQYEQDIYINYSGNSECMLCGDIDDPEFADQSEHSNLVCVHCDDYTKCSCCGRCVHEDDYGYINGDVVCNECRDDYYVYDMLNDCEIHTDCSVEIRICNEDCTKYCDDWRLSLITDEDFDDEMITTDEVICKRNRYGSRRYYIKAGTWTRDFIEGLSYNTPRMTNEYMWQLVEDADWVDTY